MNDEEIAFLRAIVADPTVAAAFADWLEERGETHRVRRWRLARKPVTAATRSLIRVALDELASLHPDERDRVVGGLPAWVVPQPVVATLPALGSIFDDRDEAERIAATLAIAFRLPASVRAAEWHADEIERCNGFAPPAPAVARREGWGIVVGVGWLVPNEPDDWPARGRRREL